MTKKKEEILRQLLEKIKEEETETFNFVLPDFLAKVIATYMSMREDLLLVKRQTNLLIEYKNTKPDRLESIYHDTVIPALWYSTVVTYGRCFTDATQASKSKLEIKNCFSEKNSELLEVHEFLMDLRHNFVAHRGETDNEHAIVFMKVPKGDLTGKTEYRIKSSRAINASNERLRECLKLFAHIQQIVEEKLQKQTKKVHKRFLHEFDDKEMENFLIR